MIHKTANLYGNGQFGDGTTIGAFCDIGSNIGNDCKLQCHVSIPPGWSIGSGVFFGPGCRLANDKKPNARALPFTWTGGGWIEDDVVIGMGALIGGGVRLGKGCVIGMGAVVTKDVPAGEIWIGNPARKYEN